MFGAWKFFAVATATIFATLVSTPASALPGENVPDTLALRLHGLLLEQCPQASVEAMLGIISNGTQGSRVEDIASALAIAAHQTDLCLNAQAAIASAREAADVANTARTTDTGAIGSSGTTPVFIPFTSFSAGAPGGGGGSDYVPPGG